MVYLNNVQHIGSNKYAVHAYNSVVRRCGVVGSTLAFGSIGHDSSNPSTAYFLIIVHQPSAS